MNKTQEPYSQHFIFFLTYEWAQEAGVLRNFRLERLAGDKPSSLLGHFKVMNKMKKY
jgi:hypothetical protein